jgi:hypothetical protein
LIVSANSPLALPFTPTMMSPGLIGGLQSEAGFTIPGGISFSFWMQARPFGDLTRSNPIPCSPFVTEVVTIFGPDGVVAAGAGALDAETGAGVAGTGLGVGAG